MKTKYIILALASLSLIAGCSKSKTEASVQDDDAWIYDATLPVPVRFASPTINVKAQINDVAQLTPVGVLGLSTSGEWGTTENDDVLIYNREARYSPSNQYVSFNPAVYYPMTNEKDFSFYGYFPYSADGVSYDSGKYSVNFDLSKGDVDVVWAKTEATEFQYDDETYTGFNARYVRAAREGYGGALPSFHFNHLLTALDFYVKSANSESVGNVRVRYLEIVNIADDATLCIADSNEPGTDGELTPGTADGTVTLLNGQQQFKILPTETESPMGVLMVVPGNSYEIIVYLTINVNHDDPEAPRTPIRATISNVNGFEVGKQYKMTITVNSPEEVTISSELEPWDTDTEDTEIPIG